MTIFTSEFIIVCRIFVFDTVIFTRIVLAPMTLTVAAFLFARHSQLKREEGVRILTVFLYLNDVEEGGGTDFPKLGITVEPKKGKAVIWYVAQCG